MSLLAAVSRTVQVTVPSSTSSSCPVTVTVCSVSQVPLVKVSDVEAAGTPLPTETSPSLVSWLATVTITFAPGCVFSFTVKAAVPPASVAWPVTVPGVSPYSSSAFCALTVTALSASYVASWVAPVFTVRVTV